MSRPSHRLFAALYDTVTRPFEPLVEEHRRYLAQDASGDLLDVGVGTGANLPYLAGTGATLHAVEPDPYMRKRAERRAEREGIDVELRDDLAESLSYADEGFDRVVSALVFCTVDEPREALDEVARVLRPGGEFRFVEHAGDDGFARRVQETVNPVWRRCAGGCRLDRDTVGIFEAHDAFETVEVESFRGVPPVSPIVRGTLRL
ncbi:MAG: SAM-dependent methyltransferase [Methanobacteriota archaeon]|jgi:SAM-dependent methyltransferase|uniref:Class I SAM-dependent methyltransferase n=1 Tax=Halorutilus salinus TaxID=2487751 RepID=A0A9Q4GGL3_9EURY|nr:class I SAM-dependent methyltransferase [Halorutilus salinus]MCX2817865.1 class I SAM-dependent methyltransferase [Halorutilus salinus]